MRGIAWYVLIQLEEPLYLEWEIPTHTQHCSVFLYRGGAYSCNYDLPVVCRVRRNIIIWAQCSDQACHGVPSGFRVTVQELHSVHNICRRSEATAGSAVRETPRVNVARVSDPPKVDQFGILDGPLIPIPTDAKSFAENLLGVTTIPSGGLPIAACAIDASSQYFQFRGPPFIASFVFLNAGVKQNFHCFHKYFPVLLYSIGSSLQIETVHTGVHQ
ncbi:unnamed protein product, partial [Iphiclides podalirius]